MKRWVAMLLTGILSVCMVQGVLADGMVTETIAPMGEIGAPTAILMEVETGTVLYEKNADEQREPASVTKIMTMLLVLEAVEQGEISLDDVVIGSEHAKEMGGSQINLDAGEEMTVYDLMMSVAVASANDAAVALAEYVGGSESGFVSLMNQKAVELGMQNTTFQNPHGLPAEKHLTTVKDIALMTAALLKNPWTATFLTCETYTIREDVNPYQMRTTNKLLGNYDGCVGGKTGYTQTAGYCMSVGATREGMTLIAVVMGAKTSEARNADLKCLLDNGFASYQSYPITVEPIEVADLPVSMGMENSVAVEVPTIKVPAQVIETGESPVVTQTVEVEPKLQAPVYPGEQVGSVKIFLDDELIYTVPLTVAAQIEPRTMKNALQEILWQMISL